MDTVAVITELIQSFIQESITQMNRSKHYILDSLILLNILKTQEIYLTVIIFKLLMKLMSQGKCQDQSNWFWWMGFSKCNNDTRMRKIKYSFEILGKLSIVWTESLEALIFSKKKIYLTLQTIFKLVEYKEQWKWILKYPK